MHTGSTSAEARRSYDELLAENAALRERTDVQDCELREVRRQLDWLKRQVAQLTQTDWLERGQNLLITGPCGSGKTHLACALGHQACLNGLATRYYRTSVGTVR